MDLFLAIFVCCLPFVKSLKYAVVFLVQPPAFLHRDPVFIETVQNTIQRFHSPFQIGCVSRLKRESRFFQHITGFTGFCDPLITQVYIGPTGKAVFLVP